MVQKISNLAVLSSTDADQIYKDIKAHGVTAGHFTNGTYAPPEALVVPTVLAGFQYVVDTEADKNAALIIAVNSDKSMEGINIKRLNALYHEVRSRTKQVRGTSSKTEEDLQKMIQEVRVMENQTTRALKVAVPVALQNPDRQVFVAFYDDATPNRFYDTLKRNDLGMETLFKWGYGTKPQEGIIESAENFKRVLGFPLPNNIDPICAAITPVEGQKGIVTVADLREGALGYVSRENKCLFRLLDPDLLKFGATGGGTDGRLKPAPHPAG